ncbi:MAG: hypothetical protein FWE30_07035 [Bacteroidales bacterium]|nr:hypothetical protein [Bacteroidales bacterium]
MKKNLIVTTIFIGAIAICLGIYANHNTAKEDLIRQNIEALAQVQKPKLAGDEPCSYNASCAPRPDGWEGMWIVYCSGCIDIKATWWTEDSEC